MSKEKLFFKIEAWLDGALPPEEAAKFESEITRSHELAREVERQRLERQAVEHLRAQKLREKMQNWPLSPPGEERAGRYRFPLKIAFWLALVIIIGGFLYFGRMWYEGTQEEPTDMPDKSQYEDKLPGEQADATDETPDTLAIKQPDALSQQPRQAEQSVHQKPAQETIQQKGQASSFAALAISYFEKDNFNDKFMGGEGNSEDSLAPAIKARAENRLADAVTLIRALRPDYPQAQEMLGQVLFEQREFREAATVYEALARNAPAYDKQLFQWKWALCLVAAYPYQKTQLENLLDTLAAQSPSGRAIELKEKIKEMR